MSAKTIETFNVPGVSCQHCVKAITEELTTIDGVDSVAVDIERKTVTVEHDGSVTEERLVHGLDEAGYAVAA